MPSGNDYGEPKAAQHRRGTQAVLNESWPLSDKSGDHACGIEDRGHSESGTASVCGEGP